MTELREWLVSFADGVWLSAAPVVFLGLRLTTTMTVLRLADGSLLVHSPVALTPERRAAVEAIGPVAHLYAPNLLHHRWIEQWSAAFPSAKVHAPTGLNKKHERLRVDRIHGGPSDPALAPLIEEIPIHGFRALETAIFYRPARTLVVAELIQNIGRPEHRWTATYARAMGFYAQPALSRAIRWTGFADRGAARRSIDVLLERSFDRLVMGHGQPLVEGAREALARAYDWLRRD